MIIYKDRRGTDSIKWDNCEKRFGKADLLPLWIADMDFEIPTCVKEALQQYVEFGVFGYYLPPDSYFQSFIAWEEKYHNYLVQPEWIRFSPGVVPSLSHLVHSFTRRGDSILITSPVYYPFGNVIQESDRVLVDSPLLRSKDGYSINYIDLEQKIVDNEVRLFIFCSPHNPIGRVWKRREIKTVLDICKKHNVLVISDEIHQDLIMPGHEQIAAGAVGDYDEILVSVTAATKTFNLAGVQNSFVVIPSEELRAKFDKYTTSIALESGNGFGYIAVQSAYENGREWLEEVLQFIHSNYVYVKETLESNLPEVWIAQLEGTYLMWIDLSAYAQSENMISLMQEKCGLAVDYGNWFGGAEHNGFVRINLATSRENLEIAVNRMIKELK